LEGVFTVFRVHAAHVKQGPGRKSDKAEARGLAHLRRSGLLPASCIPPQGHRDLRELTRDRPTLGQERRREGQRGQGVVERAHSKLAAGATESMGVSGRASLAALIQGRAAPATMAERAQGRRRLTLQVAHLDCLDAQIEACGAEMTAYLRALEPGHPPAPPTASPGAAGEAERAAAPEVPGPPLSVGRAVTVLDTLPGVDQRGAELLVAEWGTDRRRFGTASRLSAWSGVAPGNDERAGKRRSGKTRQGHHALRAGRTPRAHAAARTAGPSRSLLSQRLAARRGKQRALMAVAQAIVVSAFHRLCRHAASHELGANDVAEPRRHRFVDRLTRRIERLGYRVHLDPVPAA